MTTIQGHHPATSVHRRSGFRVESIGFRLTNIDDIDGWELTDPYIETFWLPVIGPTATVLLHFVGRNARTTSYEILDPAEITIRLGISNRTGRSDPLPGTIKRLTHHGLAVIDSHRNDPDMRVTIPARLPPVPSATQHRWPDRLRILHHRATARHHLTTARRRATPAPPRRSS